MVEFFIVECQNIENVALQLTKCNESLQGYTRSHIPAAISVNTGTTVTNEVFDPLFFCLRAKCFRCFRRLVDDILLSAVYKVN